MVNYAKYGQYSPQSSKYSNKVLIPLNYWLLFCIALSKHRKVTSLLHYSSYPKENPNIVMFR